MIKKHQKWIAILVTLTFLWLLQVSTMPLAAAAAVETTSSASAEQGPDYVESVGQQVAPAPKKSILPVVLIGVGVVAVAAVLFLVVLKTKYDVVGKWTLSLNWKNAAPDEVVIEFIGNKNKGDLIYIGSNPTKWGEYTVDGKKVTFNMLIATYVGEFTDKTHLSGTMTNSLSSSGTWTAVKTAATPTAITADLKALQGLPATVKK